MLKKFISSGNTISPANIPEGAILDKIPAAIYTVKQSMSGFYLDHTKDTFKQPKKLYGTAVNRTKKVMTAYESVSKSLGILLTGLKGAGKSLLMKEIANTMIKKGIPVIIVQDPYRGSEFMTFLDSLGECVVLLDEFGKTYKKSNSDGDNEQHDLLTFFDGIYSSKRLILLAENSKWDIADLFIDRPSRILYHWEYDRLEEDVVTGFCKDNLEVAKFLKPILAVYRTSKEFTFDSLQALVDQCNLFKAEDFSFIIDGLNIPLTVIESEKVIGVTIDGVDQLAHVDELVGDSRHGAMLKLQTRTTLSDSARKDLKKRYKEMGRKASTVPTEKVSNENMHFDADNFVSKTDDVTLYKFNYQGKEVILKIKTIESKFTYNAY